jgi:eukaryotic-like serine/threonine-protein kinase
MTAPVHEGEVLAGKYRVDKILGKGGMGVVVAAHHIQLDEKVAIKFLLPAALASKETVTRFAREARAAVRIKSEHVARVSDVGTLETGAPYMVMEYLEGGDLGNWAKEHGRPSVEQAVEFLLQACEAIAEAHAMGIVHRDLKPANLFVVRRADGLFSIKVLDFGISKVTGAAAGGADVTNTAVVMGTPLYMSPEQMQSTKDVDARTDIWALGAILHELLAGQAPFFADTMPELVVKIMSADPPSVRAVRQDVPQAVEAVIRKCLQRERTARFQNVADLAVALENHGPPRCRTSVERISRVIQRAGLSTTAQAEPANPSVAAHSGDTLTEFGRTGSKPQPKPRAKWPFATAGLLLLGVGTMTALRDRTSSDSASVVPATASGSRSAPAVAAAPLPEPVALAAASAGAGPEVSPAPDPSATASKGAMPVTDVPVTTSPRQPRAPAQSKTTGVTTRGVAASAPSTSAKPSGASLGGRM